ncbi:MAG: class I SAM-dependent methyltransferase [Bacteroidota bacterium]
MGNIADETNYDKVADIYLRHAEGKLSWNNLYERPYMLSLLDDLAGKKILDAGCGTGFYSKYALGKNAGVIAVDASQKMLDHLGKTINSPKIEMYKADLADGLSFIISDSVDHIICSLALHYLENWETIINEFYRVLKKPGKLYVSTHHPFSDYLILKKKSYYDKYLVKDTWGSGKDSFKVFYYTRSLSQLLDPFIRSPFTIISLDEPLPTAECKRLAPPIFEKLSKHPAFLFLVLQK